MLVVDPENVEGTVAGNSTVIDHFVVLSMTCIMDLVGSSMVDAEVDMVVHLEEHYHLMVQAFTIMVKQVLLGHLLQHSWVAYAFIMLTFKVPLATFMAQTMATLMRNTLVTVMVN